MRDVNKIKQSNGIVYGVGLGPGDFDLLTLKAKKILQKVDLIFAPKSSEKSKSLAVEIIKKIKNKPKVKEVVFPMTKDKKMLKKFWESAAEEINQNICSGKDVAFITLGDPFIYSTYIYLLRELKKINKNLQIKTIPGISAINAASALLEVPLAEGKEKFAVLPLPLKLSELKKVILVFDSVVLLKIGKNLAQLIKFLKKEKLEKYTYFVKKIGTQEQIIIKDIDDLSAVSGYMSLIIIKLPKAIRRGLK